MLRFRVLFLHRRRILSTQYGGDDLAISFKPSGKQSNWTVSYLCRCLERQNIEERASDNPQSHLPSLWKLLHDMNKRLGR